MSTRLIAAALLGLALASCNQGEPEVPIQQLMADQVQPTAEVYWDAVQFISDESGNHDIRPTTDAEWERTRKAAADLAAFGELLKTEAYTQGRASDWTQFSQAMVDVSKLAEQAAIDQDPDKVFEVGGTVYSVCSACHQIYPPAAGFDGEGT